MGENEGEAKNKGGKWKEVDSVVASARDAVDMLTY